MRGAFSSPLQVSPSDNVIVVLVDVGKDPLETDLRSALPNELVVANAQLLE